ncbi:MAG: hypothetical protein R2755_14095 [Acidimicrobiales bacterium]
MIARVRALAGYREFPKYGIVRRLFLYKQALLAEAGRLVDAGALDEPDDLFFLTFEEVGAAVRSGSADRALIARRRRELLAQQALTPPRVMTSDGRSSPLPTAATTSRTVPCRAWVCRPGWSKAALGSSAMWPGPSWRRATSWSPGSPIPAGRRCSSPPPRW